LPGLPNNYICFDNLGGARRMSGTKKNPLLSLRLLLLLLLLLRLRLKK